MRSKVFWVPGPWSGRLGILPRPRGGDWLGDETRAWHDEGIDVVVSLLEPDEVAHFGLEEEASSATASGVQFESCPIPDRGVPRSSEPIMRLARELHEALRSGQTVAVHCRQGIGRSAMLAAAVLISAGQSPQQALKAITASRGLEVPETAEQRKWIDEFALSLAS